MRRNDGSKDEGMGREADSSVVGVYPLPEVEAEFTSPAAVQTDESDPLPTNPEDYKDLWESSQRSYVELHERVDRLRRKIAHALDEPGMAEATRLKLVREAHNGY